MKAISDDEFFDPNILDNIKIRLYANCSYADELIVESIVKNYVSNGKIEERQLNGALREKEN